ncbi:hypothetical protein BC938DRAFT_473517 [Jimgerdemannia flammicorona]|uniref:Uncharacterized protein n=1 Tax=Jimgerdemannia flammicorona TaxID=994334 RepID=A0A433QTD1_9FUNG|nr:hypothetical protein BC938DRAFT_473517 [Jimgerdemannia flammicorona]
MAVPSLGPSPKYTSTSGQFILADDLNWREVRIFGIYGITKVSQVSSRNGAYADVVATCTKFQNSLLQQVVELAAGVSNYGKNAQEFYGMIGNDINQSATESAFIAIVSSTANTNLEHAKQTVAQLSDWQADVAKNAVATAAVARDVVAKWTSEEEIKRNAQDKSDILTKDITLAEEEYDAAVAKENEKPSILHPRTEKEKKRLAEATALALKKLQDAKAALAQCQEDKEAALEEFDTAVRVQLVVRGVEGNVNGTLRLVESLRDTWVDLIGALESVRKAMAGDNKTILLPVSQNLEADKAAWVRVAQVADEYQLDGFKAPTV